MVGKNLQNFLRKMLKKRWENQTLKNAKSKKIEWGLIWLNILLMKKF